MLPDDEEPEPPGDPEQEPQGAEVAVGDPHVPRPGQGHHPVEQGPLGGVPVRGEDHVGGQHPLRVEDDQGPAGQRGRPGGPQLLDPVLGPPQQVAVHHPAPVPGQPRVVGRPQGVDDGPGPPAGVGHQGGRHARLDPVELLVQGGGRHPDVGPPPVRGVGARLDPEDDVAEQVDQGGEEQLLLVPALGRGREQGVHVPGVEQVL